MQTKPLKSSCIYWSLDLRNNKHGHVIIFHTQTQSSPSGPCIRAICPTLRILKTLPYSTLHLTAYTSSCCEQAKDAYVIPPYLKYPGLFSTPVLSFVLILLKRNARYVSFSSGVLLRKLPTSQPEWMLFRVYWLTVKIHPSIWRK